MKFDAKVDMGGFDDLIKEFTESSQRISSELAQAQIANIRLRVAQGLDVKDQKMPGYTKEYEKRKASKGRKTGVRDLTMTGRMLGDMHVEATTEDNGKFGARIGFATATQKKKALGNQIRHPWFGISPQDEQWLSRLADKLYKKYMESE